MLRPGGRGLIMVYNRDSVWFHLYTAYEKMIVEDAFPGARRARGVPAQHRRPGVPDLAQLRAGRLRGDVRARPGFEAEFVGGYLSKNELRALEQSWAKAIADARLAREHRDFLRSLTFDFAGRPMHDGRHAGIGGTYRLRKH